MVAGTEESPFEGQDMLFESNVVITVFFVPPICNTADTYGMRLMILLDRFLQIRA